MSALQRIQQKYKTTTILVSLGATMRSKCYILFLNILFPIKKFLHLSPTIKTSIELNKFGKTFTFYIFDYSDLLALIDVIGQDEYHFPEMNSPKVILDLGSNIGTSIIAFKLKYPNSTIYGFEPNPHIFERLQKNCAQFTKIHLFPYAISDQNGTEKLFLQSEGFFSSSLNKNVAHTNYAKVETKTLDSILTTLVHSHVDLIKFDIEGIELKAFRAFKQLSSADYLIGELHTDLIEGSIEDFCTLFTHFEITNTQVTDVHFLFKAIRKT